MAQTVTTPGDWATAALEAIAEGGVAAVAVDELAPRVGASKGSFYGHFQDRAELLEAALDLWEKTRTDAIIEELEDVEDPLERLRRTCAICFTSPYAGRIEPALTSERAGDGIQAVLQRVTERRIDFLAQTFMEVGFEPLEARQRAAIMYSTYLGFFAAQGHAEAIPQRGSALDAYVDELVQMLTSVRTTAGNEEPSVQAAEDPLTTRQREVLRLLALGHTNQEIAEALVLSVRTVETHRSHVMQKLRITSRAELVRYALERGLLTD